MPGRNLISRKSINRKHIAGSTTSVSKPIYNGLRYSSGSPADLEVYDIQKQGTLHLSGDLDEIWTYGQTHFTEESLADSRIYNNDICEILDAPIVGNFTAAGAVLSMGSLDIEVGNYVTIEELTGITVHTYDGYYEVIAVTGGGTPTFTVVIDGAPTSGVINYFTIKMWDVGLLSGSFASLDSWKLLNTFSLTNILQINLSEPGSFYTWQISDESVEYANIFTSIEATAEMVSGVDYPEWRFVTLEASSNGEKWDKLGDLRDVTLSSYDTFTFDGVLLADRKYKYFRVSNQNNETAGDFVVMLKNLKHTYLASNNCWRLISGNWSAKGDIKPMETYILADTYPAVGAERQVPNAYTAAPAVYPLITTTSGAPYDGVYDVSLYIELEEVNELLGAPDPTNPKTTSSVQKFEVYSYDFVNSSWGWKTLDTSAISGAGITPEQWWNKSLQGSTEIGLYSATDNPTDRKIFFRVTSIYGSNVWKMVTGGNYTLTYKKAIESDFVAGT